MTKYKSAASEETENKRNLLCISSVYKRGKDSIRYNKTELRTWKIMMFLQKKKRGREITNKRTVFNWSRQEMLQCFAQRNNFLGFWDEDDFMGQNHRVDWPIILLLFWFNPGQNEGFFTLNRHPNRSYRLVNNMKQSPFKERQLPKSLG